MLYNAFEGLSTESTLQDLHTTTQELNETVNKRGSSSGDAMLVSGNKLRYRREFNDPTLAAFNVTTGDGATVATTNGALVVTTGTLSNQTTTITTKQSFTVPFKAQFGFKVSSKIANQEFYAELVAVNEDLSLDESSVAAWRVAGSDSTTTTVARAETRNGGISRLQSTNITTISQTSDSIFEITIESDEVQFSTRAVDSTSSRTGTVTRNSVAPDPNRMYVMRYRIVNGATAPASSTTFTSQFITAVDYTEIQTEVTGGPGHANSGQSIPVNITGGGVSLTSTSIAASTSVTGTSVAKVNSAATTNATVVKSSSARLYGYQLANTNATSWRYVKFYNTTTAPVVGTTVPIYTVPIPPGSTSDLTQTVPISHATGLTYAITANPADNDTTAVAASEVVGYIVFI